MAAAVCRRPCRPLADLSLSPSPISLRMSSFNREYYRIGAKNTVARQSRSIRTAMKGRDLSAQLPFGLHPSGHFWTYKNWTNENSVL